MYSLTTQIRMLSQEQVSIYLGASWKTLQKRAAEARLPFPAIHPVLKLYDVRLIDEWVDNTSGNGKTVRDVDAEILARAHGNGQSALPRN